jgi:hypothetical protein
MWERGICTARAYGYVEVLDVSDSVNRDISTAKGRASLYDWIVYKRESKAKEKERKG